MTDTYTADLLPCPHCNSKPVGIFGPHPQIGDYWVECDGDDPNLNIDCGDWYFAGDSKEEVAGAWNRRVNDNVTYSLKEYLQEWTDYDGAYFYMGCVLGIYDDDSMDTFREHKGTFWTNNSLGCMLGELLVRMADDGILEQNDDGFRWKIK